MRIVGIMAAYRRPGITLSTLRLLKEKQAHPFHQIIVMGDSESEAEPARETGCDFLKVPNEPLGRKYQCGLAWAMTYDPDAVCVLGSDTWLSVHWLGRCAEEIRKGADLVGKIDFYSMNARRGEGIVEILHRKYMDRTYAAQTPVGGGRLMSRRILDRAGWDIFPIGRSFALDTQSYIRLAEVNAKICILNGDAISVMGIKGPWETLNRFSRLKKSDRLENLGNIPKDRVSAWMAKQFPGGMQALERALELG